MKAFFFVNSPYLQGIQCGVQAGHAIDQMWLKYAGYAISFPDDAKADEAQLSTLIEFSRAHGTFVLLGGGDQEALLSLLLLLTDPSNLYPWQYFREPGLNNAITAVVIVLPEKFYDDRAKQTADRINNYPTMDLSVEADFNPDYSIWELHLLKRKSQCHLAH